MTTYRYRALGLRGEISEGDIEAASREVASDLLWARDITPISVKEQATARWWQRQIAFGGQSRQANIALFTREFATLLAADIPLDSALQILVNRKMRASERNLAAELRPDILNGVTMADAMEKRADVFTIEYISFVRAGELAGTLAAVLGELAYLLEQRSEWQAKIRSALLYPAILITLAAASLAIIVTVLVPSIAAIFTASNKPLPWTIGVTLSIQAHWQVILGAFGILTLACIWGRAQLRQRLELRLRFDALTFCLPVFGELLLKQQTARFARTLATLLKSGVPLLQALVSARGVLSNAHLDTQLRQATDLVRQGTLLHQAFTAETILPTDATQMIAIGEQVGKLDWMLLRVAQRLEREAETTVTRLMTALTPALTLMMAVFVGGLIITVIDAVMSMNDLALQ